MAVEFRCEKCGKLLNVEAEPSGMVECPYCKATVEVPAGVASLPRPQVPPGARPVQPAQDQPEQQYLVEPAQDALMSVMARLMPWIISAFFHAGVLVILAFITIVMFKTTAPADITVPDAEFGDQAGSRINPGHINPQLQARSLQPVNQKAWSQRDTVVPLNDTGDTEDRISLYGISGGATGGPAADFGLLPGGGGRPARFFDVRADAYHIVYVVDRSGSMLYTFDEVRREMLRSISRLHPSQTFHIVMFTSALAQEAPPRRLVPASTEYKREAMKFLKTVRAEGGPWTNPVPALKRAFEVLSRAPAAKRGKLLYLLTDGEFHDNEQVLRSIRSMNANKSVHINTILHHHRSETAMRVLRRIAEENGGRFKFIESD